MHSRWITPARLRFGEIQRVITEPGIYFKLPTNIVDSVQIVDKRLNTIEIDNNVVERSIRPLALTRKNALFAGSDGGAEHWAVVASLIETCKLNGVEPLGYLADVLTRIVNGHPNSQIDDLLPWAYIQATEFRAVA